VLELPGGTEGISTHCGCGPHVIHGVEGLGAIGASVLFPSAFFLSSTTVGGWFTVLTGVKILQSCW